jgi:hypothetical protein
VEEALVPANIGNRDAAKAFVRNLQPLGGTESQDLAATVWAARRTSRPARRTR